MSAAVVIADEVTREQYQNLMEDVAHLENWSKAPAWTDLIEESAVEDGKVAILVYATYTAFVAPSRAREMFAGWQRLDKQPDGTWA